MCFLNMFSEVDSEKVHFWRFCGSPYFDSGFVEAKRTQTRGSGRPMRTWSRKEVVDSSESVFNIVVGGADKGTIGHP